MGQLIKDSWFQLWLMVALVGGAAAAYGALRGPAAPAPRTAQAAAPPQALPAPPVRPPQPPPKPTLTGPGVMAIKKARTAGSWIVDIRDSADRDGDSVQEALSNASGGDIIYIRPGRYPGGIHIDKSVTLKGLPTAREAVIIETDTKETLVVEKGWTRLQDLEIHENGMFDASGGQLMTVILAGGKLTMEGVTVVSGGMAAVYQGSGTLEIRSSTLTSRGMGLTVFAGEFTCERCSFLRNSSVGVFISSSATSAFIDRSSFIENGTGIGSTGPLRVRNTGFSRNGGGIFAGGKTLLEHIRIDRCTGKPGLMSVFSGEVRVEASQIVNGTNSGVMLHDVSHVTIKDSEVTGNSGYAIEAYKSSRLTAKDNDFKNNRLGAYYFGDASMGDGKRNEPALPAR